MEEKLIKFVRENPFLYDKRNKSYKNVKLRDKTIKQFATELKTSEKRLKARWKTLRDKYRREKKQLRSGSSASKSKPWKWMESMSFLDDIYCANVNTSEKLDELEPLESSSLSEHFSRPTPLKKTQRSLNIEAEEEGIKNVLKLAVEQFRKPPPTKTASELYFESMAKQVDEMNLTSIQFLMLQVELQTAMIKFTNNINKT